jgi:Rab GDP dissociation inhibitor
LYIDSAGRFGDSPFIYPIYGLSGIPEAFSRKSAVYGGIYMLNVTLKSLTKSDSGYELVGEWEGEQGKCSASKVILHPSYLKELNLTNLGLNINISRRSICIVDQPIKDIGTCNAVQIILPQSQTKRLNDIYIMMIGQSHGVCKKGFFVVIISTIKEKENFDEDLKVAFDLIGPVKYRFDLEHQ